MVRLPEWPSKPRLLRFRSDTETKELPVVGNYLYCSGCIVVALRGLTHIRTSVALPLYKKAQVLSSCPRALFGRLCYTYRSPSAWPGRFQKHCTVPPLNCFWLPRKREEELKKLWQQHSLRRLKTILPPIGRAGLPETGQGLLDISWRESLCWCPLYLISLKWIEKLRKSVFLKGWGFLSASS